MSVAKQNIHTRITNGRKNDNENKNSIFMGNFIHLYTSYNMCIFFHNMTLFTEFGRVPKSLKIILTVSLLFSKNEFS